MLEVFDPRKQFCDESDDGPALAEEVPAYVPYLGLGLRTGLSRNSQACRFKFHTQYIQ